MSDDTAARHSTGVRAATPHARIGTLADAGTAHFLPTVGASPHLAQYGIVGQDDDGLVVARVRIAGEPMFIVAQDEHFLAGSVGERHAQALAAMVATARRERASAIVLLLASGGVRLHEANAAELALARALGSVLDARAAGMSVLAIATGSVFGGASVLACAADRLALLPYTRIGLSGPKVLESVHGKWELDADDPRDIEAVFGARARSSMGFADLLVDDADAIRAWVCRAVRERDDFAVSVAATHARLRERIEGEIAPPAPFEALSCFDGAAPVDNGGRLWLRDECWLTRPHPGAMLSPADLHALDEALLAHVARARSDAPKVVLLVEDTAGHVVSRAAEMRFQSQFLAHHAAVLALLRARGYRLIGVLAGIGHSAAFFSNALQAGTLYALPEARVIAMEPSAISRVTGLAAGRLIEDDPLLGQPVRHLEAQGGVDAIIADASLASLGF